ncbi:MAG: ABC transporter permease [Thermodesulfobacteriota bacterium]
MNWFAFTKIWQRNALVWRTHIMATLIGNLGQPLLFLLAMGYGLGHAVPPVDGLTYLQFLAPGLVASAVMYSAAFENTYGSYTRLSLQKTYEAILTTPLTMADLALGEIAWGATKGLIAALIMLASLPLFGVWPSPWTIALLPVLFISGAFFAAFGLIMTALASDYEFFNYFISLVITPLFLFSGIFFPLNTLSPTARLICEHLPLTPVVTLSRMFCYGRFAEPLLWKILGPLLLAAAATWLAITLLRRRLIR